MCLSLEVLSACFRTPDSLAGRLTLWGRDLFPVEWDAAASAVARGVAGVYAFAGSAEIVHLRDKTLSHVLCSSLYIAPWLMNLIVNFQVFLYQ